MISAEKKRNKKLEQVSGLPFQPAGKTTSAACRTGLGSHNHVADAEENRQRRLVCNRSKRSAESKV